MQHPTVKLIQYADDTVLLAKSLLEMQPAVDDLVDWCKIKNLKLNLTKTKAMKHRQGGHLAAHDVIKIENQPIEFVNKFVYLGLTITTTAKTFTKHIEERARKAVLQTMEINNPRNLALTTAMRLFDLKISPVATYCIKTIWNYLSPKQIETIDKVKATFLKRALCLPRNARNRIVYTIAGTATFAEDIVKKFELPQTESYKMFLENQENKLAEIDPKIYGTPALVEDNWKSSLQENRHVHTRFALHGYHHIYCDTRQFHEVDDLCRCRLCHQKCDRYHLQICTQNQWSLRRWAKSAALGELQT
jgi:hypothetical protein